MADHEEIYEDPIKQAKARKDAFIQVVQNIPLVNFFGSSIDIERPVYYDADHGFGTEYSGTIELKGSGNPPGGPPGPT